MRSLSLNLIVFIFHFLIRFGTLVIAQKGFNSIPENDKPFPSISFGENGDIIVEAQPTTEQTKLQKTLPILRNQDENDLEYVDVGDLLEEELESCEQTYSIFEGQSIEFRSRNYPSSFPDNLTSVTCFSSLKNSRISLKCDEFNLDCNREYFGVSLNGNDQRIGRKLCGTDSRFQLTSLENQLKISFQSEENSYPRDGSGPYRFKCDIRVIGMESEESGRNVSVVSDYPSSSPSSTTTTTTTTTTTEPPTTPTGCDCGRRNFQTRIVGGVEAQQHEFPWRCYLEIGRALCGCSLISNRWVMTAAHCTQVSGTVNIILGAHEKGKGSHMITMSARRVISHPQFNRRTVQNDIALIELSQEIPFSREISPVCLPFNMRNNDFVGYPAVTSGWGRTIGGAGGASPVLRKVDLPVVSNRDCNRAFFGMIRNEMICTQDSTRGACQGDSGGSLDISMNSRYYAIGITSFGNGQCRRYSVFSRVTHFLNWIEASTNENFCKI